MRDIYWSMYTTMKHKAFYYSHYSSYSRMANGAIVAIGIFVSTSSITTWIIWDYVPWLWATIVMLVNALQAFVTILPFAKQVTALKFLLPQLENLLLEVDNDWLNIDAYNDKKITALIKKHEDILKKLEHQFVEDVYFPLLHSCEKKAERDCINFFYHRYKVKE